MFVATSTAEVNDFICKIITEIPKDISDAENIKKYKLSANMSGLFRVIEVSRTVEYSTTQNNSDIISNESEFSTFIKKRTVRRRNINICKLVEVKLIVVE